MVKVERSQTPPASLAIEKQKASGSYTEPDVIKQLSQDFNTSVRSLRHMGLKWSIYTPMAAI